jgi:hypothetical protein
MGILDRQFLAPGVLASAGMLGQQFLARETLAPS